MRPGIYGHVGGGSNRCPTHERRILTTFTPDASVAATPGVYAPQHDSHLLIDAMASEVALENRTVLDLCTGTGIVAIAAAQLGAHSVTAIDISRRAIRCARRNARASGVRIQARVGGLYEALARGPYDIVVCNPPYVPAAEGDGPSLQDPGPSQAWDAGPEGRMMLDPLCDSASRLLSGDGVMLIVQSEFADPERSIRMLRRRRIYAETVMAQKVPFGPVLHDRASWMESAGLIPVGCREEELIVIRGEKL